MHSQLTPFGLPTRIRGDVEGRGWGRKRRDQGAPRWSTFYVVSVPVAACRLGAPLSPVLSHLPPPTHPLPPPLRSAPAPPAAAHQPEAFALGIETLLWGGRALVQLRGGLPALLTTQSRVCFSAKAAPVSAVGGGQRGLPRSPWDPHAGPSFPDCPSGAAGGLLSDLLQLVASSQHGALAVPCRQAAARKSVYGTPPPAPRNHRTAPSANTQVAWSHHHPHVTQPAQGSAAAAAQRPHDQEGAAQPVC